MTWLQGLCRQQAARELRGVHRVAERMVQAGLSHEQALRHFERAYLLRAAVASDGCMLRMADRIGVHRNTMTRLMDAVGLRPAEGRRDQLIARSAASRARAVRRGGRAPSLTADQVRDVRSYAAAHNWPGALRQYALSHGLSVHVVRNVASGRTQRDLPEQVAA